MTMKSTLAALLLGASILAPVLADEAQEKAIEYRQSVYTVVGWNFKPMGAMIKGEKPYNAAEFQRMAENVAFMSKLAAEGFIPGSDAKAGDTEAKDDIWKKPEDFKAKMADFEKASAELAVVAKGGDLNAIKPVFGKAAETCKACHKAFRKD
ncbi:MAG: cytochrome c [Halothiobacillaceae bacterium]|nr:cytochrome c [Halothiobacillaceae bacterium]